MQERGSGKRLPLALLLTGAVLLLAGNTGASLGFLVFALGGLLVLAALLLTLWRLRRSGRPGVAKLARGAWMAAVWLIGLGIFSFFLVEGMILTHAGGTKEPDAATLVVLGAGLRGDQPSAILEARLSAALDYLLAHPEAQVVVTGGQGGDEQYTEGSVMAAWLEKRGISRERIYVEEQSTDTWENLYFAKGIIEENRLPGPVAVVSNEFHLFRAEVLAQQVGLGEIQTLSAPVPYRHQIPGVYLREYCSILLMALRSLI